jgi:hypothetical protein
MADLTRWFNNDGGVKGVARDPYRDRQSVYYRALFDDDGNLQDGVLEELEDFARKHKVSALSHVAELIHAERFARNTKGNYSTIYYWR